MARLAVLVGQFPPRERAAREATLRRYSDEALRIEPVEIPANPNVRQVTADLPDSLAQLVLAVMRQVETAGYDAVMPLGGLDLGVELARDSLRIPLIVPVQTCIDEAARIAGRFGLLTYTSSVIPYVRELAARYGHTDTVAGIRAMEIELPDIIDQVGLLRERFISVGRQLVRDGAGAIVMIGVCCPVWLDPDEMTNEVGVPVLDVVSVPIRRARALLSGQP